MHLLVDGICRDARLGDRTRKVQNLRRQLARLPHPLNPLHLTLTSRRVFKCDFRVVDLWNISCKRWQDAGICIVWPTDVCRHWHRWGHNAFLQWGSVFSPTNAHCRDLRQIKALSLFFSQFHQLRQAPSSIDLLGVYVRALARGIGHLTSQGAMFELQRRKATYCLLPHRVRQPPHSNGQSVVR